MPMLTAPPDAWTTVPGSGSMVTYVECRRGGVYVDTTGSAATKEEGISLADGVHQIFPADLVIRVQPLFDQEVELFYHPYGAG